MTWQDPPDPDSLTLPIEATDTDPRIVLGSKIPTVLSNYYAGQGETVSSAILFFDATGGYEYIGNLSGGAAVIGAVRGAVVTELFFLWQLTGIGGEIQVSAPMRWTTAGVVEAWHALALQNGWVPVGGADPTPAYRRVPSPAESVQIVGSISGGINANGTVIATLPVGYRPTTHKTLFPIATDASIAGGATPRMELQTNGNLVINAVGASTFIFFNTIIPLEA